ncbi:MAG: SecY-interacting protein Syd [bacterium]|nr:SecY-interacting protein Syd [Gammaproteobacteria bacterium]HIL94688.1 SecY-interacting protein Syd [Pseudomonadales bacterium]
MSHVSEALDHLHNKILTLNGVEYFTNDFDPDWRSECEISTVGDSTHWKPSLQSSSLNFSGLANAAEADIHPDIQAYYGSYWSGGLKLKSREGPVDLIQLWNSADFDRLIENLVGHLFMKQRAKQSFTVFFATTEPDSELFLSIDNESGKILLEEPGQTPIRELDTDITSFLNRLEAEPISPGASR